MKTSDLSTDNLKNTGPGWVDTWARDTVKWYWSADTLFWQLSIDHNIDVQNQFSCARKLARKCEIEHWLPCGADGQAGGRCTVTWIPNFLGWVDLLSYGAPTTRARGASLWCKWIHPTIGWRRDKHKTHKHAHCSWILFSVSRVRSKTMHLSSAIRHKIYLNYYMSHRFEIFSALKFSRTALLGCRLAASRLRELLVGNQ